MPFRDLLLYGGIIAFIVGLARAVPLRGARRAAVVALRIAALVVVLLAWRGCAVVRHEARPRHLVYLVDQSDSIDARKTEWIARRVASLDAIRPASVSRAVVAFGGQTQVVEPAGRTRLSDVSAITRLLTGATIQRDTTNLETALLAGLSAMPQQRHSRVILLSDGRQTAGNVERLLPHLRRLGLEVYPIPVETTGPAGLVWDQLAVPGVVQRGSSIPVKLAFTNGTGRPQPVDISVSLHGVPVDRQRRRLTPGAQVLSVSVPAIQTGTMSLEIAVTFPSQAGKAGAPQRRSAYVEVEGPPRIFVVLDRPAELPLLAAALKRREIGVAVGTVRDLPASAAGLLDYDALLLYHVAKSSISQPQVDALKEYVGRFGGGIMMVGLGGKLDQEITRAAPLDELLPVRFEPKGLQEAKRRVCMIMLIDRSASMMGPRIAATKRAAVELVKQLAPEDLVGVLAFDTAPYIVVEMQPAGQVSATLIEKLVHLKSTGGTDILPALKAGQARLEASGATVKHMVLLSDGITPIDVKTYRQFLSQCTGQHVSISTIGIGAAFVNTNFLSWLALMTGGAFYQMNNLDDLPTLIARDTQNALGQLPFVEGYFRPAKPEGAEWFSGVAEWPPVRGYLTTTAKPASQVELMIRQLAAQEEPLFVQWAVGTGRVAVFASDADTRWTPSWVQWPQFDAVWAEAVRRVMRSRPSEDVFAWVDEQDAIPQFVLEGELADPSAELISDGDRRFSLALVQQGRFRWKAPVGHIDSGWYQLVVESHRSGGFTPPHGDASSAEIASQPSSRGAGLTRRWIQIGRSERNLEQPDLPADGVFLRRIAQATGGSMELPDQAFLPATEQADVVVPMYGWLLPLVLLLVLIEAALRSSTML